MFSGKSFDVKVLPVCFCISSQSSTEHSIHSLEKSSALSSGTEALSTGEPKGEKYGLLTTVLSVNILIPADIMVLKYQ